LTESLSLRTPRETAFLAECAECKGRGERGEENTSGASQIYPLSSNEPRFLRFRPSFAPRAATSANRSGATTPDSRQTRRGYLTRQQAPRRGPRPSNKHLDMGYGPATRTSKRASDTPATRTASNYPAPHVPTNFPIRKFMHHLPNLPSSKMGGQTPCRKMRIRSAGGVFIRSNVR
jgi:hypothetical protein